MALQPQCASIHAWIDTDLRPPSSFITAVMDFAMMSAAQRDRELVADLAAKGRRLREPQMVSIGRTPTAHEAGLLGNRFDVLAVANATRRRYR